MTCSGLEMIDFVLIDSNVTTVLYYRIYIFILLILTGLIPS